MRRRFQGLHEADRSGADELPEGLFLVRIERAQYRWHPQKPYYSLGFIVIEPLPFARKAIAGRLYCTQKTLWKLTWFLSDFGYDAELLAQDEIDDNRLVGLRGVIKASRVVLNGTSLLNLDGFAPACQWHELSPSVPVGRNPEVAWGTSLVDDLDK